MATTPSGSPCVSRAVKFFPFCHPELAKDLLQQREILAGDASRAQQDSEIVNHDSVVYEVTKVIKEQKNEELNSPACVRGS